MEIKLLLRTVLWVLWGIFSSVSAQEINLKSGLKSTAFDAKSEIFYAIYTDSIIAYNIADYSIHKKIKPRYSYQFLETSKAICSQNSLFFIEHFGGIVHQLVEDSIVRVDKSFSHGMQLNSTLFSRNDTIMRFGGYGFWSARNFFTYFSSDTKEWELLTPYGSKEAPEGRFGSWICQNDSLVYVLKGLVVNKKNPVAIDSVSDIWQFNFNKRKWKNLGNLNKALFGLNYIGSTGDKILIGNFKELGAVDPFNNRITYYKFPSPLYYVDTALSFLGVSCFYHKGFLYVVSQKRASISDSKAGENELRQAARDQHILYKISEKDLFKSPLRETELYSKNSFPWFPVLGLLGFVIVFGVSVVGYSRFKAKDKVLFQNNTLNYKGKKLKLEPEAADLLRLMITSGGEVSSQSLTSFVEKTGLSESHNLKLKNQLIASINIRLRALLNSEKDLIITARSSQDKRLKSYVLDHTLFLIR